jgi:hypothetical protein
MSLIEGDLDMFSDVEFDFIKQAAKRTKNQGELAVAKWIIDLNGHWYGPWNWTDTKLKIIQFCAEECKRQHSGEMSVYDMISAWDFAIETSPPRRPYVKRLTLAFIEHIGSLVEPIDNIKGFRTIPIGVTDGFGGWNEKAQWDRVPQLLTHLIESYYEGNLDPKKVWDEVENGSGPIGFHNLSKRAEDQFYYEYENIHPFRDGNGRSGKILYNYLLGTLENPQMPPNFWGSSNP